MSPIHSGEYDIVWKTLTQEDEKHHSYAKLTKGETTALVKLGVLHGQLAPSLAKDLLTRTQSLAAIFDGDNPKSIEHSVREHRLRIDQLYAERAPIVINLLATLFVSQTHPDLENIWTRDITI